MKARPLVCSVRLHTPSAENTSSLAQIRCQIQRRSSLYAKFKIKKKKSTNQICLMDFYVLVKLCSLFKIIHKVNSRFQIQCYVIIPRCHNPVQIKSNSNFSPHYATLGIDGKKKKKKKLQQEMSSLKQREMFQHWRRIQIQHHMLFICHVVKVVGNYEIATFHN